MATPRPLIFMFYFFILSFLGCVLFVLYLFWMRNRKKKVEFSFSPLFLVTAIELKLNKNKTLEFSRTHERTYIFFRVFFIWSCYTHTQCSTNNIIYWVDRLIVIFIYVHVYSVWWRYVYTDII